MRLLGHLEQVAKFHLFHSHLYTWGNNSAYLTHCCKSTSLLWKAWPLRTLMPTSNLGDKVLSEEKRKALSLCQKRKTNWASVRKLCVPPWEKDEGFYNNNSKLPSNGGAKVLPYRVPTCCGAQALESSSSSSYARGPAAVAPGLQDRLSRTRAVAVLQHVKSPRTRDRTHISCMLSSLSIGW